MSANELQIKVIQFEEQLAKNLIPFSFLGHLGAIYFQLASEILKRDQFDDKQKKQVNNIYSKFDTLINLTGITFFEKEVKDQKFATYVYFTRQIEELLKAIDEAIQYNEQSNLVIANDKVTASLFALMAIKKYIRKSLKPLNEFYEETTGY